MTRPRVDEPRAPTEVGELLADPRNRRTHSARNLAMITDALGEVGAARSIVIDEHNEILAGNGVVEAAAGAGITRLQVVEADGQTIVAVRRRGLTDQQKRALAIYDNRTAELAEWNIEQLKTDLANGEDLSAFFFEKELTELFGTYGRPGLTEPDALPPARATDIAPGQVFALGTHRLICGDSTHPATITALLDGAEPFLMVTDPPYGVDYDPTWRHAQGLNNSPRTGKVANDGQVDWTAAWRLFPGTVAYVWHAGRFAAEVQESLTHAGLTIRAQIIWNKPRIVIGRGHYHWKHEPCWYAFRDGAGSSKWAGGRKQSTVWSIEPIRILDGELTPEDVTARWVGPRDQTTVWDIAQTDDTGLTAHGTQKPVECMLRPIRNHGTRDDAVFEPFLGSGTTIIAAEQLGRRCFAAELTPTYVQMAIDRWESFTGGKAAKVGEVYI